MKNPIKTIFLVVLIVGAGGFYGGMKYQQSKQPAYGQFMGRGDGSRIGGVNPTGQTTRNNFRPVTGEILNIDSGTITVKLPDGSSKIVVLPDSARIDKAETVSVGDLTVGSNVMVVGQENSDGSVTAQSVQINPIRQGMPESTPQPVM